MIKTNKRLGTTLLILASLLAISGYFAPGPRKAAAHPLGNFTINRYSGVEIDPNRISILYVVDMAEIPAFQEIRQIDTDADGKIDADEDRYPVR